MKQLIIDNTDRNVTCYDDIKMIHASNEECIVINNYYPKLQIKEILYKLWDFTDNEKEIYNEILYALINKFTPYKQNIIKSCSIAHNKNKITYERAFNNLQTKGILTVDINNKIILNDNYNIYNTLVNRKTIKCIIINV